MSNATLPEELRPLVHQEVDTLDDVGLETVHRVILRMRMEQSLERLDGMADEMRAKGVMETAARDHRRSPRRSPGAGHDRLH